MYNSLPSLHFRSSLPGIDENRLHVLNKNSSLSNALGVIKDRMTNEIPQLIRKVP